MIYAKKKHGRRSSKNVEVSTRTLLQLQKGTADQQQGDGGSAGFYLHQRSMAGASGTALSRFVNRCLLQQLVSRLSGATRPLVSYPPRLKQAFPGFT